MASSVSKTILIGNLGADPDLRYTGGGSAVAKISVATSESWTDKNTGQKVDRTEWHRVVIFGKLAEVVGQYCKKGSKIYIEGRNQTREYEKDGVKRYTTEVVVDARGQIQLLDGRPADAQPARPSRTTVNAPSSYETPDYPAFYDEEVPH